MIEQCEKCALYNSLGCPYNLDLAEKISDCDEFRPREERKTCNDCLGYEFCSSAYRNRSITCSKFKDRRDIVEDIFNKLDNRLSYYRRYAELNPLIATILQIIDDVKKEYEEVSK